MKKIILASTSPRRKEIFSKLNIPFEIVSSNYVEDMTLEMPPEELAKFLSKEKAREVAKRYPDHIVIGADTFVVLDGELLGKPKTPEIARMMLKKISSRTVEVISGITIVEPLNKSSISRSVISKITFRKITNEEIEGYIKTGIPLDKAGGIAVQEIGAIFIENLSGDYFNIMGLSLFETAKILKEIEVKIL